MQAELLRVSGLEAGYGRVPILLGVELAVRPGEFVGILGHNGMGKTTLLRTIMGHIPATAGTIAFGGAEITRASPARRARAGLGYVPQGRQIFPVLTVLENLRVGAARLRAADAARTIDRVVDELPRLKPIMNRTGGVLSGGEQQILALARCLCGEPKLVLLDEPTEGIQPSIIEEMKEQLVRLATTRSLAIVLVEQNLDFIGAASRVLMIRKGRLGAPIDPASLYHADAFMGLDAPAPQPNGPAPC